jgi:hypothetical protein
MMDDETNADEILKAMSVAGELQDAELPLDNLARGLAEVMANLQDVLEEEDAAMLIEIGAALMRRHKRLTN